MRETQLQITSATRRRSTLAICEIWGRTAERASVHRQNDRREGGLTGRGSRRERRGRVAKDRLRTGKRTGEVRTRRDRRTEGREVQASRRGRVSNRNVVRIQNARGTGYNGRRGGQNSDAERCASEAGAARASERGEERAAQTRCTHRRHRTEHGPAQVVRAWEYLVPGVGVNLGCDIALSRSVTNPHTVTPAQWRRPPPTPPSTLSTSSTTFATSATAQ